MAKLLLGEILKAFKLVNDARIKKALVHQKENKCRIGQSMIALGYVSEEQLAKALAKQFDLKFVNLENAEKAVPKEVLDSISRTLALEHKIIPIKKTDTTLFIAISDPLNLGTLDQLRFILGTAVQCVMTTPEGIQKSLKKYYVEEGEGMDAEWKETFDSITKTDIAFREDNEDSEYEESDAPIIKLVEQMITQAIEQRASDIHVEPMEGRVRVRYRIDGNCHEVNTIRKSLQGPLLNRLKLMAKMDIAEKRKPQDGRIQTKFERKSIDLRVSALPASHGESVVLRILDKEASLVSLEHLGMSNTVEARFRRIIKRPNGIFLVTGPTGSGKTTTLYATLGELNRPDVKIITAEDPVEYNLTGINQCQVRHKIGLDFARILRAMLRQAPNVILVGEIRDIETAEIAIQAALTGHLVFSTLHTNDSVSSLTRLIDMGVKPFLVATSVQAILAQRLVRTICQKCKELYTPHEIELKMVGLKTADLKGRQIYKSREGGCKDCKGLGYRGRTGVHELLELTNEVRELTFEGAPIHVIRERARAGGALNTLQEDGVRKVLEGRTTIESILQIIHREDIAH
ncbi:MAG: ATPase, T2SS/T4P/T4SS family [Planctomycetes bacterium]|nr:ATPase, T2SS/T4P/T4SS family [Planctomycetota bacterium]